MTLRKLAWPIFKFLLRFILPAIVIGLGVVLILQFAGVFFGYRPFGGLF